MFISGRALGGKLATPGTLPAHSHLDYSCRRNSATIRSSDPNYVEHCMLLASTVTDFDRHCLAARLGG